MFPKDRKSTNRLQTLRSLKRRCTISVGTGSYINYNRSTRTQSTNHTNSKSKRSNLLPLPPKPSGLKSTNCHGHPLRLRESLSIDSQSISSFNITETDEQAPFTLNSDSASASQQAMVEENKRNLVLFDSTNMAGDNVQQRRRASLRNGHRSVNNQTAVTPIDQSNECDDKSILSSSCDHNHQSHNENNDFSSANSSPAANKKGGGGGRSKLFSSVQLKKRLSRRFSFFTKKGIKQSKSPRTIVNPSKACQQQSGTETSSQSNGYCGSSSALSDDCLANQIVHCGVDQVDSISIQDGERTLIEQEPVNHDTSICTSCNESLLAEIRDIVQQTANETSNSNGMSSTLSSSSSEMLLLNCSSSSQKEGQLSSNNLAGGQQSACHKTMQDHLDNLATNESFQRKLSSWTKKMETKDNKPRSSNVKSSVHSDCGNQDVDDILEASPSSSPPIKSTLAKGQRKLAIVTKFDCLQSCRNNVQDFLTAKGINCKANK